MENYQLEFIQTNSPDGGFLQSKEWRKFQEATGRKTFHIDSFEAQELSSWKPRSLALGELGFWANIIEHSLPISGKYFYAPRGPVCHPELDSGSKEIPDQVRNDNSFKIGMTEIIDLAKKENVGWIRIDPASSAILDLIKNNIHFQIKKAPHDMQPREIFAIDITKPEEQLLSEMKSKTRYNIRLAEKKGVKISVITKNSHPEIDSGSAKLDSGSEAGMTNRYFDEFLRLVKITSERQGITPHPENYYRQMFETLPNLKLYVAEHAEKVIVANLVLTFGTTVTYLHGASDDKYKNLMAPYLLQWRQIQDAKAAGCDKYDFGGVKFGDDKNNDWVGITRFKTGFSPNTKLIEFPGSYDIILNPVKYKIYRIIQKIKSYL